MRVVALHADVLVATSAAWQTTCTIVRSGDEAFVVDSPVFPTELELLPTLVQQAGFPLSGLLATHADWDHLLARLAFPDAPLGVAETTAARLRAEPGDAARRLRAFDDEHYVERAGTLRLGDVQALPVPGHLDIGEQALELHPTGGHTADGMAVWIPWARVLVCGDHVSPCEIPMLSPGGSVSEYRATLRRLAPLAEQADHVVPGHGAVLDAQRALAILREDDAYLAALERDPAGSASALPIARRSPEQKKIHERNVALVTGA
ncbi:MBL fold metallo-hydrolase [Conexibacter sp. W3-3-2]|uniref:MBL fold metallo-hydrolase n=1 Tax=Paraconexibacter algicola TaxID=2133960 RepID=A0A2T4UKM0_9ACTN|nr:MULTISPECIES: MBL fold metallo-hydrolase [Solirubrobacterales]MTD46121.1 MBL fold metallo-hydrolase [Conexibacter sp. W3-3-2]PTL59796.1 MBL fold metallo-hydrolase [Paraconexibacter algicola]